MVFSFKLHHSMKSEKAMPAPASPKFRLLGLHFHDTLSYLNN